MARFALCLLLVVLAGALLAAGCSQDENADDDTPSANIDGSMFLLASAPDEAKSVSEVRKNSTDGDAVVVVGRIGGAPDPWVEGRAAFTIVDESLKPCNEREDDACEKPWDYCCDLAVLGDNTAFVEIVDGQGKVVEAGAKKLLDITELQTVVVLGKAKRNADGDLVVQADGVYVKR